MSKKTGAMIACAVGAWAAGAGAQDWARGKDVYLAHCAQCHGPAGTPYRLDPARPGEYLRDQRKVPLVDGRAAPAAPFAHPRPRDLTAGVFKLRSTPSGTLPTDADLVRSIAEGMPGSSMPAWKETLSAEEIDDVAAYVKTLSGRFESEKPGRPIPLEPLPKTPESVKSGESSYLNMNCFLCHGMSGRGDGDVGIYRRDAADQENKLSAADLTKRWNFRAGPRVEDIYKSIMTGLTLMPAHEEAFGGGEQGRRKAWDLAYFVDSLSRPAAKATGSLRVSRAAGPLPQSAKDPAWDALEPDDAFLAGQAIVPPRHHEPSVDMVSVRGLFNDEETALLIEWNDPRRNAAPIPDALQLQFPLASGEPPHFLEGSRGRPVLSWRWNAKDDRVSSVRVEGPGSKAAPAPTAGLSASSSYDQGRWRVLIRCRREAFPGGGSDVPVAFSIWDGDPGEREERGLKRAISGWNALAFVPTREAAAGPPAWAAAAPRQFPSVVRLRGKEVELAKLRSPLKDSPAAAAEGRALYAQKCLACHGAALDGRGHFARAFFPRPADLREAGAAGEPYLFWRIAAGGAGLPAASRPWSSAMPAWEKELDDRSIWALARFIADYGRDGRGPGK